MKPPTLHSDNEPEAVPEAAKGPTEVPSETSEDACGPLRIRVMVLDDDRVDLEAVRRCLRSIDSLEVDFVGCRSVDEAQEHCSSETFDLIFVDYFLVGVTGLDALESLRQNGCSVPAVLLTGGSGEEMLHEALRAGVMDYVPKDRLDPTVMQQTIRSALKKAELRARISRKQIELEETIDSLRKRQEEIENFYHNVSHELKTPLTGAREFVALVRDGVAGLLNDAQSKLLDAALRNCDQMGHCVNDILDAARIETGKLVLKRERTNLVTVLNDAVNSVRPKLAEKSIKLQTRGLQGPLHCSIDPHRIYQVAANLISNAVKFTPDNGVVELYLERLPRNTASITVSDSGPGVAAGDEERVFDRLYQSNTKDAAVLGGLGMGLYICKQIVELHGGRLACRSSDLGGAEFTFVLPNAAPVVCASKAAPADPPQLATTTGGRA